MKLALFSLLVTLTLADHLTNHESPYVYVLSYDQNTQPSGPLILPPLQPSHSFQPTFPASLFQQETPFQPQINIPSGHFQPQPNLPSGPFQPQPQFPPVQTLPQPHLPSVRLPQAMKMLVCDPVNKPLVDVTRNGIDYHFSWCHDGDLSYTWEQANSYCSSVGFQAVSIEDQGKNSFITSIISLNPIPWIWTSGNRLSSHNWVWAHGSPVQYTNWSPTGGAGVPQPDNREDNNERCLAVLKNFYQDGIKWHDIACHHTKPVICEKTSHHM